MNTVYKITRPDRTTYHGFLYAPDVEYTFPGKGELCTSAYAHAYWTPELAVLYNPVHANYNPFLLFKAAGEIQQDDGTKLGLTRIVLPALSLTRVPTFCTNQRVAWAIACSWLHPWATDTWKRWASRWLTGTDRSEAAAWTAAARAASWAARAAAEAGAAGAGKKIAVYQTKLAQWAASSDEVWQPETWPAE